THCPPTSFNSKDTLIFNGSCSTSSCTCDTTFNVKAISVTSNYTGTISTNTGITLTFATGVFTGGIFTGGSIPITFTESFRINGGTFTSTSGVLTLIGDVAFTSGTFNHNNGTVIFQKASPTTTVISGTSNASTTFTLYKAEFAATSQNSQFNIRNMTMQIE